MWKFRHGSQVLLIVRMRIKGKKVGFISVFRYFFLYVILKVVSRIFEIFEVMFQIF
jgi:hypothetical protein